MQGRPAVLIASEAYEPTTPSLFTVSFVPPPANVAAFRASSTAAPSPAWCGVRWFPRCLVSFMAVPFGSRRWRSVGGTRPWRFPAGRAMLAPRRPLEGDAETRLERAHRRERRNVAVATPV